MCANLLARSVALSQNTSTSPPPALSAHDPPLPAKEGHRRPLRQTNGQNQLHVSTASSSSSQSQSSRVSADTKSKSPLHVSGPADSSRQSSGVSAASSSSSRASRRACPPTPRASRRCTCPAPPTAAGSRRACPPPAPAAARASRRACPPTPRASQSMWRLPCHPESTFTTVEEAKRAANRFARGFGYALVVKSVSRDARGEHRRVVMGCDRHGTRRVYASRSVRRRVNAASRRCGCEMELSIVRQVEVISGAVVWSIEHRDRALLHNHAPSTHPGAHPVHRRAARTESILAAIAADAEIGVRAAQTIARLNLVDPDNLLLNRDVYNERRRAVNARVEGLTRMEYLLRELENGEYFVEHERDTQNRVTHLFFAFGPAVEIFRDNYDVIQLDCTYRTNRFGLPLLNIIGVIGSNSTIHIAQAFIRNEQEPDYDWALRQLHAMMRLNGIPHPQVFFSDAELALINAVEAIFPGIPHLLCLWHVVKNVETHARRTTFRQVRDEDAATSGTVKWKDSEGHRSFCDAFLRVIRSTTEEEYEFRKRELYMLSEVEAAYIEDVWLSLWKRRLVRCWTNSVVHFGLQATSRVEGYHATMKAWLGTSRGDFLTVHSRLRHWWTQSVNKYWASRAIDATRIPNT